MAVHHLRERVVKDHAESHIRAMANVFLLYTPPGNAEAMVYYEDTIRRKVALSRIPPQCPFESACDPDIDLRPGPVAVWGSVGEPRNRSNYEAMTEASNLVGARGWSGSPTRSRTWMTSRLTLRRVGRERRGEYFAWSKRVQASQTLIDAHISMSGDKGGMSSTILAACEAAAQGTRGICAQAFLFLLILAFVGLPRDAVAQRCSKGKPCGNTCIARDKECRVGRGSATWAVGADTTTYSPEVVAAPATNAEGRVLCIVGRIVDGDTIRCSDGRRVRLLLIDAPERNQPPFGLAASRELARLVPRGSPTQLEYDVQKTDRYGRDLAYVHMSDGRIANEEILRSGYAVVLVYPPNVRYVERFRAAVADAQAQKRGLWATSAFECLPSDHRRGRC